MTMPKDPVILLSCINTLLRDKYSSLNELCDSEDVCISDIAQPLAAIGYTYNEKTNQFV